MKKIITLLLAWTCVMAMGFPVFAEGIAGQELNDGTYSIEVSSSSSMFRIVKAELTVSDGEMQAVLTLGGTGYEKLFMGTREEAEQAGEDAMIPYVEDAEGAYTYTVPVQALDSDIACAAFSKRKQQWYDRTLVFQSASLPDGALREEKGMEESDPAAGGASGEGSSAMENGTAADSAGGEKDGAGEQLPAAKTENPELVPVVLKETDGTYTMEVSLEGGSGRASVTSPAEIEIRDGMAEVKLEWSSSSYDYMYVNGTKYDPVNEEGNSVFRIPLLAFDGMEVIADTTAMSRPHEIAYTLVFDRDTLKRAEAGHFAWIAEAAGILAVAVFCAVFFLRRQKPKAEE